MSDILPPVTRRDFLANSSVGTSLIGEGRRKKSGKLCQIGYQRRSNPRYLFTYNELVSCGILKKGAAGQAAGGSGAIAS